MLNVNDVLDILAIPLLGVIPESETVLRASNLGVPVSHDQGSAAGKAYADAVGRFLGETLEYRFIMPEKRGLMQRLFGKPA